MIHIITLLITLIYITIKFYLIKIGNFEYFLIYTIFDVGFLLIQLLYYHSIIGATIWAVGTLIDLTICYLLLVKEKL